MGTGIYKIAKGSKRELTSKEVKAYIMKINGWTSEEYRKKYDIFKNKLRSYEAFRESRGEETARQSPAQLLYKEAKAKESLGADYRPSIKMKLIQSFTSVSMGKAGKKALRGKTYQARRASAFEKATFSRFEGFMKANAFARKIWNEIEDPVKRDQALADYANKLHAKMDEEGKMREDEAIPFGEVTGSPDTIEFDLSEYM